MGRINEELGNVLQKALDLVSEMQQDIMTIEHVFYTLLQTPLGNYLLHRVTKVTALDFETTGDGNCFRDGYFPFLCLRAKVVKLIRKGKEIDCSLWYWRIVFFIWNLLFPIRKELLWLLRKISRLKNI